MRMTGLVAVLAVGAVLAACSTSVDGDAEQASPPSPSPSAPSAGVAAPPPGATPTAQAPLDEVIDWIEAGTPTDPGAFHVAFRDGMTTRLGDDIAFTAASGVAHGTTQCVTDVRLTDGAVTCLLELTSPPPAPAQAEGMWKPGWVEFSGTELSVGALRGDPGPFGNGTGTELGTGQSIMFGDNRCRSDASGLYCVNYAHRSAVRIAADAVSPYGCLAEAPAPPETAALFRC